MSHETKPQHMTVAELGIHCTQETELYFRHQSHDPRYCFELFRRAIQDQDQSAWALICCQYQPLVAGWVRQHSRFASSGEEVQYFVNGAFGKIAITLTPDKFGGFSDLGSLLRYLKMCVHSVIVDYDRSAEQPRLRALDNVSREQARDESPEEQVMDHSYQRELWNLIKARLQDEKEYSVIYGSFVLALKPQEVYDLFRTLFCDVDEIYRIKQNVVFRLRRDLELRNFLGEDG